jgi:hypothetical protein
MSKIQITETPAPIRQEGVKNGSAHLVGPLRFRGGALWISNLGHLNLFRISNFEFRI